MEHAHFQHLEDFVGHPPFVQHVPLVHIGSTISPFKVFGQTQLDNGDLREDQSHDTDPTIHRKFSALPLQPEQPLTSTLSLSTSLSPERLIAGQRTSMNSQAVNVCDQEQLPNTSPELHSIMMNFLADTNVGGFEICLPLVPPDEENYTVDMPTHTSSRRNGKPCMRCRALKRKVLAVI